MARITQREAVRTLLRSNAVPQSFIIVSKTAGKPPSSIAGNVLNSPLGTIVGFHGTPGSDLSGAAGAFGDALFGQLTNFAGLPGNGLRGGGSLPGLGQGPGGSTTPGPIGKHGGGGDPAADDGGDDTSTSVTTANPDGSVTETTGNADGSITTTTTNPDGSVTETTNNTDGTTTTTTTSGGTTASIDENGVITLSTIDVNTTTTGGDPTGGDPTGGEIIPDMNDSANWYEGVEEQFPTGPDGPGDDDEKLGAVEIIAGIGAILLSKGKDGKAILGGAVSVTKGYYGIKKGYEKNHPSGPGPKGPGPNESGQNSNPDGSGNGGPKQFVGEKPNPETGSGGGPHSFGERPAPDSDGKGTPHSFSLRGSATIGTHTFQVALTRAVSGATLLFISPAAKADGAAKAGIRLQASS